MSKSAQFIIALAFIAAIFSGCASDSGVEDAGAAGYVTFRDIPGVTENEIKAVEAIVKEGRVFVYGIMQSTETFHGAGGEIRGFTALLCDWMTKLFGVPFEIRFYEWDELLAGLESGEIDFTGEMTATDERRKTYFMTDAIAQRLTSYFRISGSPPLPMIASARRVRYGLLSETTTIGSVTAARGDAFDAFSIDEYEEAYTMLKNGVIDAFIDEATAEAAFDAYGDVVVENFLPLIYGPVSLTTRNKANEAVITVMQKALEDGAVSYLTGLYNRGNSSYKEHKLSMRLTAEERAYLQNRPVVKFVSEHDNYPVSFYNAHDREFQGIAHDVIREVGALTGIRFELVNDRSADWAQIFAMLENGEAAMVTELVRTPEREGRFVWPQTAILVDYHALLSKTEHRDIQLNEILHMKVGLVDGYAQTEAFRKWFPDHRNTVVYDNYDLAFASLTRGEVDMLMGSQNKLLVRTNYHGRPGYKANIVFDYSYESTFGFNRSEALLCSIIDKTLEIVDIRGIEGRWTRRTYDYRMKFQQQQYMGIIGGIVLLMCILVLLSLSVSKKRIEKESRFKSMFLATMSHEIRTPMNAVIGITQIQLEKEGLPEEHKIALRKIYSSGNTLLGIINDVLDMSKIETGKLEITPAKYDVSNLINDAVQLNAVRIGSKQIEFKLDAGGSLPSMLYGDELRLKQILNNLLSNAIKYTDKGFVKLSVRHTADGGDTVLCFIVEDTGQGMKPEDSQRLFSEYLRFNTTANRTTEGTGLGLNITKKLVGMMDGVIDVQSEYGKGSVFTVKVKQKTVECKPIGAQVAKDLCGFTYTSDRRKELRSVARDMMPYGKVLIVDDVDTNLYVAEGLLSSYKLQTETAASGFEALDKVNSGAVYDIIFMDHMMPQMDGIETTKKIRGLGYKGAIVAFTANALAGNENLFKSNGFDGFLSKPIDIRQLNAALNKFIRDRYPQEAQKYKQQEQELAALKKLSFGEKEISRDADADASEDSGFLAAQLEIITAACEACDEALACAALQRLKEKRWKSKTAAALEEMHGMLFLHKDFEGIAQKAREM